MLIFLPQSKFRCSDRVWNTVFQDQEAINQFWCIAMFRKWHRSEYRNLSFDSNDFHVNFTIFIYIASSSSFTDDEFDVPARHFLKTGLLLDITIMCIVSPVKTIQELWKFIYLVKWTDLSDFIKAIYIFYHVKKNLLAIKIKCHFNFGILSFRIFRLLFDSNWMMQYSVWLWTSRAVCDIYI